ncbi:MAG TPA: LPXTG cell wall anchor domain-containing protein [Allosphingosinicella sp.]|jgi:LPXTG-motif cell wall-anchored protein
MKQASPRFARAALLLAAAALPLTPLAAQEAQPPAQPPAAQPEPTPPPTVEAPPAPVAATPAPASVQAAPTAAAPAPRAAAPAPRAAPVRTARPAPRAAPRPAPVLRAPAPVATPAAPPASTTTTTTTPTVAITPPTTTVPSTTAPETIPAAPSTGVDTVTPPPTKQQQPNLDQRTATWPWFLLGALLIAAAALLFARRRRRSREDVYEETYAPAYEAAPEPEPVAVVPVAAVAPVAAPEPVGDPDLALMMRPFRAGVAGDDARVEFELTVDNRGSGPARGVRVTTWMLAAGSSEAERSLIANRDGANTPPVDIDAGEARTLQAQVALPTSEIDGDSVLPVVVADARYVLADGSEAHATARFAVGVPDGEELAHFDTEHPSGLHEGVVAQALD